MSDLANLLGQVLALVARQEQRLDTVIRHLEKVCRKLEVEVGDAPHTFHVTAKPVDDTSTSTPDSDPVTENVTEPKSAGMKFGEFQEAPVVSDTNAPAAFSPPKSKGKK